MVFSREMRPLQKGILIFATLLIISGCGGEYIFGSWARDSASLLQRASDENVAESNRLARLAEKDAAEAKLELAKIRAPRIVKNEAALINELSQHRGKRFWIITQKGQGSSFGEQLDLSRQLKSAFLAAGWVLERRSVVADQTQLDPEFSDVSDLGCSVAFAHDAPSSALGHAIWAALQKAEIDCKENPADGLVPEFVELEIGLH
jgi:hypothetical protein